MSVRVLARPTEDHPNRAVMVSETAWATFCDAEHAKDYEQHPGDIGPLASLYLDWIKRWGRE